jgi:adenylate cyclase
MGKQGFKRILTAVFNADVVGYSRLIGEDESETVNNLESYKGVMFTLIEQHRGRVVDSPVDNLLADFVSVVDAAQKELYARNGVCLKTAECSFGSESIRELCSNDRENSR